MLKNLSEEACHKNFFAELEKVFTLPNPQNHFREISPYIANLATANKDNQNTLKEYQKSLDEHQYHLNNILNSRSWKLVVKIKTII